MIYSASDLIDSSSPLDDLKADYESLGNPSLLSLWYAIFLGRPMPIAGLVLADDFNGYSYLNVKSELMNDEWMNFITNLTIFGLNRQWYYFEVAPKFQYVNSTIMQLFLN